MRNLILTAILIITIATTAYGYTGLVIDARGTGAMPGMSPKIVDSYGNEVYGTVTVDPDWAVEEGVASYAEDDNDALAAGNDPLIVKAIGLGDDPCKTSVMVNNSDAREIVRANYQDRFLDQFKVVIVL